jgi:hypothetical protein
MIKKTSIWPLAKEERIIPRQIRAIPRYHRVGICSRKMTLDESTTNPNVRGVEG